MMTGIMRAWDEMVPGEPLAWLSIACLLVVITKTVVFVSATKMRPSLMQSVGMALIGLSAAVMLVQKLEGWHTSPQYAVLHVGMALYFGGRLRELWSEWRGPPRSVCNHACQGISCSDQDCPMRKVLPIVRVPNGVRRG